MIALDTNVVVRIVTQDDPQQAGAARKLVEQADRLATFDQGFAQVAQRLDERPVELLGS